MAACDDEEFEGPEEDGGGGGQVHLLEEGEEGGDLHAGTRTSSRLRYSCTLRMFR